MSNEVDHQMVAGKWKRDYVFAMNDQTVRILNGIQSLCKHFERRELDIVALLKDVANMISQHFGIREVAIGLKSPADGLYRYEVVLGTKEEAEKALRRIAYTADDFMGSSKYKGWTLSKYSRLFLAEDSPYANDEKNSYSRQVLLGSKRRKMTEALEEDYVDVYIYGMGDELLGWIEVSGTRTGDLPDVAAIRWIECLSRVIGIAISYDHVRRGIPSR